MKSELAQCASTIRKELKETYPSVKFRVRSKSFSMGNSVDVYYPKGQVDRSELSRILEKYQYGTFCGMTDSSGIKPDNGLPRAKFVHCSPDYLTSSAQ